MQILIIEDEQHTAQRLHQLIAKYDKNIEITASLSSVQESIKWFNENPKPHLIFQDIELSDGKCFEIYDNISIQVPVIFTTAYNEYALKSFEVNSIDYLVKPYDFNDIEKALNKFKQYHHLFAKANTDIIREVLKQNTNAVKTRFLIRKGDNFESIETKDIAHIFSEDGLSFAKLFNGKKYPLDQSLNELENLLDEQQFFRVNRNYIVSNQSISKIVTWFNSRLKLELNPSCDNEIITSRDRVKAFKSWLGA